MDYYEESLKMHARCGGKLTTASLTPLRTRDDLSTAYTPGVARPCTEIQNHPEEVYKYTMKSRTVAVVSDGSAVLGLGNIGASAAIPVMEGKAILFKAFGGVDAVPICIETQDADEIVHIVRNIAPVFGGINLEDISAPRCFEIENRLQTALDIPVFHDDRHGTAVVVAAAVINAFKLLEKPLSEIRAVVNGAGAAGTTVVQMLLALGVRDLVVCDRAGILGAGFSDPVTDDRAALWASTNPEGLRGGLAEAVRGRDLFVGVSKPKLLTEDMVAGMGERPVVFAMANPEPEIMPDRAKAAGAAVVGTGRSDFPNQINNVLAFPGIFKGALAARARAVTEDMKLAAAHALAGVVKPGELNAEHIVPDPFDEAVATAVAEAVAAAWRDRREA